MPKKIGLSVGATAHVQYLETLNYSGGF